jgi:hypothetical protein
MDTSTSNESTNFLTSLQATWEKTTELPIDDRIKIRRDYLKLFFREVTACHTRGEGERANMLFQFAMSHVNDIWNDMGTKLAGTIARMATTQSPILRINSL